MRNRPIKAAPLACASCARNVSALVWRGDKGAVCAACDLRLLKRERRERLLDLATPEQFR